MKTGSKYTISTSGALIVVGVISRVDEGFVEGYEMHTTSKGLLINFGPFLRREREVVLLREVVEIPEREG